MRWLQIIPELPLNAGTLTASARSVALSPLSFSFHQGSNCLRLKQMTTPGAASKRSLHSTELRYLCVYRVRVLARDSSKIRGMILHSRSWSWACADAYLLQCQEASHGLSCGLSQDIYERTCVGMHVCIWISLLCINGFCYVYALPECMHYNTCTPGACGSQKTVEEFRSQGL